MKQRRSNSFFLGVGMRQEWSSSFSNFVRINFIWKKKKKMEKINEIYDFIGILEN